MSMLAATPGRQDGLAEPAAPALRPTSCDEGLWSTEANTPIGWAAEDFR